MKQCAKSGSDPDPSPCLASLSEGNPFRREEEKERATMD